MKKISIAYLTLYIISGIVMYLLNINFALSYFLIFINSFLIQYFNLIFINKEVEAEDIFITSLFGSIIGLYTYSILDFLFILFTNRPIFMFIFIFLIGLIIILSSIIWNILYFTKSYMGIIKIRFTILSLLSLSILILSVIFIIQIYDYFRLLFSSINKPIIPSTLSIVFIAITIPYLVYLYLDPTLTMIKNIHLYNFKNKKPILLFLRCFKYDKNKAYETMIYKISLAMEDNYEILQIGNPQKIFKGYETCNTFYLPTTNWQDSISSFIQKSSLIFVVVNKSNGVLWEILNHDKDFEKFIFYINDELESIISDDYFHESLQHNNDIAQVLYENRNKIERDIFFFFNKNKIYYYKDIFKIIMVYFEVNKHLPSKDFIKKNCSYYVGTNPTRLNYLNLLDTILHL